MQNVAFRARTRGCSNDVVIALEKQEQDVRGCSNDLVIALGKQEHGVGHGPVEMQVVK